MRSEDQLLANKSTRRSRGCLSSLAKKLPILKFCTRGIPADYFLNRMKPNALFPILFIQNNFTDIFYQIIATVHFREILSGYFLFSRFDWSIFVTQLVAKHMKKIIT
jgi:hypothetical protein